jgi:hypothetical protein
MGNNNFLGLPMFKDKKKIIQLNKIIQCNFYDDENRNVFDSIGNILNLLSKEIKQYTVKGANIKPQIKRTESYPFVSIEMENILSFDDIYKGFLDGFKLNDTLLWTKWKNDAKDSSIIDFSQSFLKLVNVENLVRVGFLTAYQTSIDNIFNNSIFSESFDFEPLQSTFQIKYKEYILKLVLQKIDDKNVNILWDVGYSKLLPIKKYKKFITALLTNKDIEMVNFLSKYK